LNTSSANWCPHFHRLCDAEQSSHFSMPRIIDISAGTAASVGARLGGVKGLLLLPEKILLRLFMTFNSEVFLLVIILEEFNGR